MREIIINFLLSKLLRITPVETYFEYIKGNILKDGKKIEENDIKRWANEIKLIRELDIFGIVTSTLNMEAQTYIFKDSKNFKDVINGKMILWTLRQMNGYFDKIVEIDERNTRIREESEKSKLNTKVDNKQNL